MNLYTLAKAFSPKRHRTDEMLRLILTTYIACACLVPQMSAPGAGLTRPNVVFLLADDLGWSDLGCYGSTFHQTPNLDRMAREGMRFTSFYSAGSVCSPTRSSIMTGKYPARTGITDWIPGQEVSGRKLVQLRPRTQLPLEEVTFAETMKAEGYHTAYIGKWHLGGKGFLPTNQGFEIYLGEEKKAPGGGDNNARLKHRLESTDRYTTDALDFLDKRDPSKAFFLLLSYHDVHTPIQAMPGFVERFENKAVSLQGSTPETIEHDGRTRMRQDNPAYASMVAAVDASAGKIRSKLEQSGLASNTIVFFTSDNGGLSTMKVAGPTSNRPLRAGKGWLYEGGIRVPLIVWGPASTKAGGVCGAPLISCDFYPTLLDLFVLPPLPRQHVDGVSFATLLRGGLAPPPRPLYWHYPHYHGSTWTPGAAIRDGDWKLLQFYESQRVELYDLAKDLGESHDLAESNPAKTRELLRRLEQWQKSVNAQIPGGNLKSDLTSATETRKKRRNQKAN